MTNLTRSQMAALARNTQTRRAGSLGRPAKWAPETVPDLETGLGMTDGAAWYFVAACLEDASLLMQTISLQKPPGATGYVFKIPRGQDIKLYIKIEIVINPHQTFICGRSFHLSTGSK